VRRRSWWQCCNESCSSVVCGRHSIVCTQRTQVLTTAARSHSGTRHSASDPADTRSSCPRPSTDRRSYTDPSYSPALQSYQPLATFFRAAQARRQEMKWGVVKKWKMGGVFCKKSGPFLNEGCIMYSISIFYFTFYLFGGFVRTQRTPPPCLRACCQSCC